jgi:hypothetical protein
MHSTSNLKDGYLGSGTHLRYSIRKYGIDNFKIEILEWCITRENLIEKEKEIITENHINNPNCYNLKFGGLGGGGFVNKEHQFKCSQAAGKKHSERLLNDEEYRKNYSEKLSESGKKRYEEGNLKTLSCDWTGKNHSEISKQKMSTSKKGKGLGSSNSQFNTCWVTKNNENKKIKTSEIHLYLNDGWIKGRFIFCSN